VYGKQAGNHVAALGEALLSLCAVAVLCALGFERASTRVVRESVQDVYSEL
jgi:hypothetical protein